MIIDEALYALAAYEMAKQQAEKRRCSDSSYDIREINADIS